MCEKCEEKKCKRSCGRRKQSCEPESKPSPLPPKCAAAQACGLKTDGGKVVVEVPFDGIVPFAGSNNLVWPALSTISWATNGVAQIDEPGVYLVCYSIRLTNVPNPDVITTQVELRIANSCGVCPTSCGGCQYQSLTNAAGLQSVPCSVGAPDAGGQIIQRTVLVNVQYPCARLVLANISTGVEDIQPDLTMELDITPASFSIAKIASCGC